MRENIKDKELLVSKLECLEDKVGRIQQELQKKSHEVEEGSKLQNQLLKQVDLANTEMSKVQREVRGVWEMLHVETIIGLEGKFKELQVNHGERGEV